MPTGAVARLGTVRYRHPGGVFDLQVDGEDVVTAGEDGTLRIGLLSSGASRHWTAVSGSPLLALDRAESRVYVGGVDGAVYAVDVESGTSETVADGGIGVIAVLAAAGGDLLLGSDSGARSASLDLRTGIHRWTREGGEAGVTSVAVADDRAAFGFDDGTVRVIGVRDGKVQAEWPAHAADVQDLAWCEDRLLTAGSDGEVGKLLVWDVDRQKQVVFFKPLPEPLAALAVLSSDSVLAAGEGGLLARLSLPDASVTWMNDETEEDVRRMALAGDRRQVLLVGESGVLRGYDVESGGRIQTLPAHEQDVFSGAWSADGSRVVTCGEDGSVRLWDPATMEEAWLGVGSDGPVYDVQIVGDSVVAGGEDGSLLCWDLSASATPSGMDHVLSPSQVIPGESGSPIHCLAVSPDGAYLAVGHADGMIRIHDATSFALVREFLGQWETVWTLTFSNDGSTLVSGGVDGVVRGWDLDSGERKYKLTGHEAWVIGSGVHGDRLLTASATAVRTWSMETGEAGPVLELDDCSEIVLAGDALFVGCESGALARYAVGSLEKEADFFGHMGRIQMLRVSPDGERLLAADGSGQILIWEIGK
jgi:WD40 repeat protein